MMTGNATATGRNGTEHNGDTWAGPVILPHQAACRCPSRHLWDYHNLLQLLLRTETLISQTNGTGPSRLAICSVCQEGCPRWWSKY